MGAVVQKGTGVVQTRSTSGKLTFHVEFLTIQSGFLRSRDPFCYRNVVRVRNRLMSRVMWTGPGFCTLPTPFVILL